MVGSEWLRAHQRKAVAEGAIAHGKAVDSLLNYETVKYFGNERHIAERYDQSLAEVERLTVKSLDLPQPDRHRVRRPSWPAGTGIILLLALRRVDAGTMTVGELVLVNTYLLQLTRPMDRLGQLYRSIKQAFVDLEQLLELLAEEPEIEDQPDAVPLPAGPGAVAFEACLLRLRPRRGRSCGDVDFRLPPGQRVALVGPTGAGKSTDRPPAVPLLRPDRRPRSWSTATTCASLTQACLRAAIAVVPQDTVLFNDTIGYNLAFGRPDATPAEIEAAAEAAQLHGFIAAPARTATIRWSASAASSCPAARSSAWRSPAPSSSARA